MRDEPDHVFGLSVLPPAPSRNQAEFMQRHDIVNIARGFQTRGEEDAELADLNFWFTLV